MLSSELMGVFALGVLWLNTLLIAAHAWQRHRELGEVAARLRASRARGALVHARIARGAGPDGSFATSDVEQLGRAMTTSGPPRILFTDRAMHPALHGGSVVIDGREVEVEAREDVRVWCGTLAARGDREAFDAAWPSASTFRGHVATLERRLAAGDDVWLERDAAGEGGVRLVACEDPEAVVQRARRPLRALVTMALGGATIVTVLALWPPVFGTISTLGGAAGLGFFLAIQPLGTRARDQALLPDRRPIGGLWQRPV